LVAQDGLLHEHDVAVSAFVEEPGAGDSGGDGFEWTLLWIENTAAQLTEGRPDAGAGGRGQGVSPE
jgi:hypothetical protein